MFKQVILCFVAVFTFVCATKAQGDNTKKSRIALFAPFYLDTLFNASGTYLPGKTIPTYAKPALDFYQGVLLALDSLDKLGIALDVKFFDTRNKNQSIYKVADSGLLNEVDLIIGAVSGTEYLDLAAVAKEKKIPFVSASYPNDGGVSGNPYVVIVNPKLNTHLQALYNYVLKTHGTNKLMLMRRKAAADDRVGEVFKSLNASGSGSVLNIQTVTLNTPLTSKNVEASLDSLRENVIICGSLDDFFGRSLLTSVIPLASKYKITLVGMPTWEGYNELARTDIKNLPVIYPSSLFYGASEDSTWVSGFRRTFGFKTYSLPTEMAYRGYELTFLFGNMLNVYGRDLIKEIGENKYRVLTDFDFKPIHWSKNSSTPDYYENKRIYILKHLNSEVSRAN